jgi:signal transduction histidine kinase
MSGEPEQPRQFSARSSEASRSTPIDGETTVVDVSTTGVIAATPRRPARPTPSPVVRFAAVALQGQTYRNLLYLLLALPLGVVYLVVVAAGLATGAALSVVFVGLAILVATLIAWRGMAVIERGLARSLLRVHVHPPIDRDLHVPFRRLVERWLRDPVTWKSLVFVIAKLPLGAVAFALLALPGFSALVLALAPIIVAFTPVIFFGWEMSTPVQALPFVPAGVLGCLICLHIVNGLAWLFGECARVMLGPSTAELRERIEGMRESSARILAAADDERRRIERDLHDGAQQRLVSLSVLLGVAESKLRTDPAAVLPLVAQAREEANSAVTELRELARGLHPALLSDRGLGPALEVLASRAPVPVEVTGVPEHRLPPAVEATVYFITAEALTNVARYAQATAAWVQLAEVRDRLRIVVRDDGVGGADPHLGTGLRGLRDRVDALDGRFEVRSSPGGGTAIVAEIPLEAT